MQLSQLFVVNLRKNSGNCKIIAIFDCQIEAHFVKKLNQIINWIVWSLIALYAIIMLTIHLPVFQHYIGGKVAEALSEKFGTKAIIGRIDVGFLNRIIIDDVVLYDLQAEEMLRVARLSAKVDIMPLTEGKIAISSAQLFGARARLYKQDEKSAPNFQFALNALASKDTTSQTPLDLRINSLIIRRSSLSYDQRDVESATELNPNHLSISDISANIILKTLTEDSIDIHVKRLGLHERSGLDLTKLAFRLKAGRREASLRNLVLQMPNTLLQSDSIEASYLFEGKQLDTTSIKYQGAFRDSYITPSDLRCFHTSLKNLQKTIQLKFAFKGTGERTDISQLSLSTETGEVNLQANGWLNYSQPRLSWNTKIDDLTLSDNMIDFIMKNIPDIPEQVRQIGNLQLSGNYGGASDGSLSGTGMIQTSIGNLNMDFLMDDKKQFTGDMETEGIDLRQLSGDEHFGNLAASLSLSGQIGQNINAQGLISQLDYNDYHFNNIGINGQYTSHDISGFLKIEDPNLAIELDGTYVLPSGQDGSHQMNVNALISRISPKALRLSEQWGDALFSGHVDAELSGRSLNDAQGSLRVSNFTMSEGGSSPWTLDNLLVTTGYADNLHYISLVSDFAKADLRGNFQIGTLAQSLINFIGSALPTLPGLPPTSDKANNDFALNLHVYKTDWLQRLLGIDLDISQPMTLAARVNDPMRSINLEGLLPNLTYNGATYTNGNIHITTPSDTIKCNLAVDKLMDNGQTLNLVLDAKAIDNHLNTSLNWDNGRQESRNSGDLNLITHLYQNVEAKPEAHIHVQPSHIVLNNNIWNVNSSDVIYSEDNLHVDHFMVYNGLQHIIIDGKASKYNYDLLTIDLNDVEVGYILDLVNFHAVEFSGKASGTALVIAPFGNFEANANLNVDEFKFERGRMGTLYAQVNWNGEAEQIDIQAIADDGPDAKTHIKGYVSPKYNAIDLGFRAEGTYIDFMQNFTNSFLSSVTGHANGEVRLAGTFEEINLTGKLVAEGKATVTALNTTYTFREDTVILIPDEIELHNMTIYDKYNREAKLSGAIHHENLTNMTFDLFVNTDNLLAYDFKDFGESTFYGTVYASGDVSIIGRPGEVTIDCNVTPQKNSVFVYNASSPDAISNQEFIEWGSGNQGHRLHSSGTGQKPANAIPDDIPTDIYINFLVNTTPDGTLRLLMDANTNDYITLNGEGTIRATYYNKGSFNMFGTYTVDHGTYGVTIQNIIKKNFTFNRGGTIIFGGDPYNAALNLQAVYTVNGVSLSDLNIGNSFASNTIRVNCLMNIGGQPNSPQIDFDLEMPTVNADEQQMVRSIINGQQEMNQQVLYLLGIGRFYNQGQNNAGTSQQDQTSLAMQSFISGTLSSQLNSLLSTVIKNDNWNFGANISTGNEGWHNAEYEGLISGRMLNNRLLLNGQFGYRDNATRATPSFIGDFDIQYLLYPNGNLALKVYNQTNDRYFTKSSLNTQGIGIIMKKDFNGPPDLFSSGSKKKKKSKKKE